MKTLFVMSMSLMVASFSATAAPIATCEAIKAFEDAVAMKTVYRGSQSVNGTYVRCFIDGVGNAETCNYSLKIMDKNKNVLKQVAVSKNSVIDLSYTRKDGNPIETYSINGPSGEKSVVTIATEGAYGFTLSLKSNAASVSCSMLDE